MPYCSFCDRNHRRKRGEHVIPKWITREFPDVDWTITNLLTNYIRKGERYIPLVTPVPCVKCDNEWMSDLERLVKPILLPLLYGKPSTLTMLDQKVLAIWFFKTAVMYDLHATETAPRPRYFEDAEHQQLKRNRSFHPAYRFYLGRYVGERFFHVQETHSDVYVAPRNDLKPSGDAVWGYAFTLVINHLVLQIFCSKVDPGLPIYALDFRPFYIRLGESAPAEFPPPLTFNDSFLNTFINRWDDSSPPPAT